MSDPRLAHLFDPRGVIVVGASSHPAKFGFSALHNVLAHGFTGKVFATRRFPERAAASSLASSLRR